MRKLTKNELIELRACKQMDNGQQEFFTRDLRYLSEPAESALRFIEHLRDAFLCEGLHHVVKGVTGESLRHVFGTGGDENKARVDTPFAELLCRFNAVSAVHDDVHKDDVKGLCLYRGRKALSAAEILRFGNQVVFPRPLGDSAAELLPLRAVVVNDRYFHRVSPPLCFYQPFYH